VISEETINQAVDRRLEVAKPLKIFLFGSYARGEAREHSDLDFLAPGNGSPA
jgi:predicted nucleotidyltransferase